MSSTRHAVVLGPSLTGLGKRPSLTPAHHVDFETGIGPRGARMDESRKKPVSGSKLLSDIVCPHANAVEGVLEWSARYDGEFATNVGEFARILLNRRAIWPLGPSQP